jgi:hypothetical protein
MRAKFGYNPSNSGATGTTTGMRGNNATFNATNAIDPNLGISSRLAATIASHAITAELGGGKVRGQRGWLSGGVLWVTLTQHR